MRPLKILQASAGSGKTFSLTVHYLSLLFSNENKYREILAITFTNKATEEMKTRILDVLKGLAEDSEKIESYRNIILEAYPHLDKQALQQKAATIYSKILHDYNRFSVSTIDGFMQKVIRGFSFELGLSANYNLELNLEKVKEELLQKLDGLLSHNKILLDWVIQLAMGKIKDNKNWNYRNDLKDLLREIFKENFEAFEVSLSGRSQEFVTNLFNEYVQLTRNQIDHYETEWKEKVDAAITLITQYDIDKSHFKNGTNSPLWKMENLLEDEDKKTDKLFAFIDRPELWFKENKGSNELYTRLNQLLTDMQKFYDTHIGAYRLAKAFQKNIYYLRLMQEVALLLADYRHENDNLLISDAQKLVTGITDEAGDNPAFIWEKVGIRYRNFLFDEFQDTSVKQWRSLKALLSNALSTATGAQTDHLIVGDVKQSIYRWRSGDWDILHKRAKQEVLPENVVEESLEENYRSSKNIIEFNNMLYKTIPTILQQELNLSISHQSEGIKQWWQENNLNEIITDVYAGSYQKIAPNTPDGGLIKVLSLKKDEGRYWENEFREDSLKSIVTEIKDLVLNKNYPYGDIALLVRTNTEATLCVNKLMQENIPVLSGDALLIANNPAIDLIINTLKIFTGLQDQTALYKANCIALYHLIHQKKVNPSLYFNLKIHSLDSLSNALPERLCKNWKSWLQLPLAELIENLFESYKLTDIPQLVPYLLAFRDLVSKATTLGESGIISFLHWWQEEGCTYALPSPEGSNAVQIITIHKSKGLAFKAVFVPFCIWDLKPSAKSIFWVSAQDTPYHQIGKIPLKFDAGLERSAVATEYFNELLYSFMDNLNMLYVATTRAKEYLYIATMAAKQLKSLSNIGHAVNQAVYEMDASDFATKGIYERGTVSPAKNEEVKKNFLQLHTYPTSDRLSLLYTPEEEKNIVHLLNMEHSARRGTLAHDVLAHAADEYQADAYINKLLLEGTIPQAEVVTLKQAVMDVLNDPQIVELFGKAEKNIIERNIIDTEGKMQRPDRILITKEDVILLDYKFTWQENVLHQQQLLKYITILQQMGYKNIRAFLFYTISRKLIPVLP